jgi:hypothetical protein
LAEDNSGRPVDRLGENLGGEWRVKGKERKVLDVGGVERLLGGQERVRKGVKGKASGRSVDGPSNFGAWWKLQVLPDENARALELSKICGFKRRAGDGAV